MNKRLFFAVLLLPFFAGAQNLVMNGRIKMGTMGFAQQRFLRFDTNPKQHFIPLETVKLPDGGHALKMTSPYSESSTITTRQFPLKNKTKYTIRVKMRSTDPGSVRVSVCSIVNKWRMFNAYYTVGQEWKEYEYHFTTGPKDGNGFFYHINITAKSLNGDFFVRDLELFETSSNTENGLQFAADVKEPVLETTQKTLEWNVPVYAWNGTGKSFKGNVTVTAQEQFFPEKTHKVQVPVELAPGECKVFPVKFTTDYGCYEITEKCSEASRCVPAYQGVMGKYTAKKLDFDKDFSIGIVGGLYINKPAKVLHTTCWSEPEKLLEFLAKMGCRMFRELGNGIESTSWALMEPEEGKWDFSYLDYRLRLFEKYKIEPVPCVGAAYCYGHPSWQPVGFPKWIREASIPAKRVKYNWPQAKHTAVPPLDKWRAYASKLTAHAKGRIRYYEIFNEPNGYLPPE